ncbi:phosphoribosylaminoimidazolecarboxamide formyltransferase [Caminibacter sp.]
MLKPIIEHQNELKEIYKKMDFLRENFDLGNVDAFYEELMDLAKEMKNELNYHFNLQIYSYGENEKAKKFVLENLLVRDMLNRMLDFIIAKSYEKSMDAFSKFDDFDEILRAYLKKEKGLFIQELKEVLSEEEIKECEEKLLKLV